MRILKARSKTWLGAVAPAAACIALSLAVSVRAEAQISDDVVRIGVSSDHSGVNSAATGLGTVAAVRLAVKDFGGTVRGKPIEVLDGR
jgi:branched-chain amino acid transport system substrate-binding protein